MTRLRILLVSLLVASCAGQSPLAPTDSRVGLGSQSADPHAVIAAHDIEPNELSTESDDLTSESDDLTTESDDLSTVPDDLSAAVAKTFTLSGVITDKSYSAWKISSATVTVTPGPLVAKSTSAGKYTVKVRAGTSTIKIAKAGYKTATVRKTLSKATTLTTALVPVKPAGATARCKDRTWSKSQNRSGTCSHHKGVAYWVCPGKLCK